MAAAAATLRAASGSGAVVQIDPHGSHFGFALATRWGRVLEGRFADGDGVLLRLPDGRRQVRIRLRADSVEIVGSPEYSRHTRGEGFFDARRFPDVEFISEPFDLALLRDGGQMAGQLRIRDVSRRELLQVTPSGCADPGATCTVLVHGAVRRDHYGMRRWRTVIGNQVHLQLQVRMRGLPQ